MVNEMGGVDIEVTEPMDDHDSGAEFDPGHYHMDGDSLLAYSRDRKSYPDAEAAYRKAVTLAPQPLVVLHSELVRILSDQRRYRDALPEAKRETEIDPKSYSAHFDYALILQKLGQLAPSANEYLEAIKIDPKQSAPR